MTTGRRRTLAALTGIVLCAILSAPGAPALAYTSTSRVQPGYPASSLAMTVVGKPRLGTVVTLRVTGSNALFPVPDDLEFPNPPQSYTLDVYVQPRAVYSTCAPDVYAQEGRTERLIDRVTQIAYGLEEGPAGTFQHTVKYRVGSARRIMFCAYTRYASADNIAMSALKHDLRSRARAR